MVTVGHFEFLKNCIFQLRGPLAQAPCVKGPKKAIKTYIWHSFEKSFNNIVTYLGKILSKLQFPKIAIFRLKALAPYDLGIIKSSKKYIYDLF